MADMEKDQTDLVRRLQADPGDEAAQRELHERYRARLIRFCGTRLADPNDAEDCVQDVFQDMFARIGELRDPQAFEGWMLTIARRRVGHYNGGTESATRAEAGEADIPDLPDPVADVEHDVRMRELLGTVTDAIDSLQPPLDSVMRAFIIGGGLRGSELAPRFGWDASKADHELNRARSGLFAALETLVVVRTGRAACTQLNELCRQQRIGAGRKTRLDRDQRRNIHRHIAQCRICRPRADAARDRGHWALGPGIAQLADYLRRRRSGARLAAAALMIAMISLLAAGDGLRPGPSPARPVAIAPRAAPQPTPAPIPTETRRPTKRPTKRPAAPRSPGANRRGAPVDNGGETPPPPSTPSPPKTPSPPRTPPKTPSPPRTPSRPTTPPPPRAPSPPRTADCTTSIALNPLTVRVNAVLLCISVSVGG